MDPKPVGVRANRGRRSERRGVCKCNPPMKSSGWSSSLAAGDSSRRLKAPRRSLPGVGHDAPAPPTHEATPTGRRGLPLSAGCGRFRGSIQDARLGCPERPSRWRGPTRLLADEDHASAGAGSVPASPSASAESSSPAAAIAFHASEPSAHLFDRSAPCATSDSRSLVRVASLSCCNFAGGPGSR